MVTKDDAMEYLVELEDVLADLYMLSEPEHKAISDRLKEIKKYVWNSDYKIRPAIKA